MSGELGSTKDRAMTKTPAITFEQSGAFIEAFSLGWTANGPLAGLRVAIKDIIDVAGRQTGCGNPT
jgi:amidase